MQGVEDRWHKWPDEKPPKPGHYLTWVPNTAAPGVMPWNGEVWVWWIGLGPEVEPTHWRPLPEPPSEGEG